MSGGTEILNCKCGGQATEIGESALSVIVCEKCGISRSEFEPDFDGHLRHFERNKRLWNIGVRSNPPEVRLVDSLPLSKEEDEALRKGLHKSVKIQRKIK